MKLPKQIRKDLAVAMGNLTADLSPAWHLAAAGMLEQIAAEIRREVSGDPPPAAIPTGL